MEMMLSPPKVRRLDVFWALDERSADQTLGDDVVEELVVEELDWVENLEMMMRPCPGCGVAVLARAVDDCWLRSGLMVSLDDEASRDGFRWFVRSDELFDWDREEMVVLVDVMDIWVCIESLDACEDGVGDRLRCGLCKLCCCLSASSFLIASSFDFRFKGGGGGKLVRVVGLDTGVAVLSGCISGRALSVS
jgi:hypothetical protein